MVHLETNVQIPQLQLQVVTDARHKSTQVTCTNGDEVSLT